MSIKDIKTDSSSINNVFDVPNTQYGIETDSNNEIRNNESISNNGRISLFNDIITTNASSTSNNLLTSSGALNSRFNEIEDDILDLGSVASDNTIFSVVDNANGNMKEISTVKSGTLATGTNTFSDTTTIGTTVDLTSLFSNGDAIRIISTVNSSDFLITTVNTISASVITLNGTWDFGNIEVKLYKMNYNTSLQIGDIIGGSPSDMLQSLYFANTPTKSSIQVVPQGYVSTNKNLEISASFGHSLEELNIVSDNVNMSNNLTVENELTTKDLNVTDTITTKDLNVTDTITTKDLNVTDTSSITNLTVTNIIMANPFYNIYMKSSGVNIPTGTSNLIVLAKNASTYLTNSKIMYNTSDIIHVVTTGYYKFDIYMEMDCLVTSTFDINIGYGGSEFISSYDIISTYNTNKINCSIILKIDALTYTNIPIFIENMTDSSNNLTNLQMTVSKISSL